MLGVLQQDLVRLRDAAIDGVTGNGSDRLALTPRQAEVLLWAIRGYSRTEIATRVGSSPRTVAKHLEHAYEALGVHSRSQAIERILLSGPLEPGFGAGAGHPTFGRAGGQSSTYATEITAELIPSRPQVTRSRNPQTGAPPLRLPASGRTSMGCPMASVTLDAQASAASKSGASRR